MSRLEGLAQPLARTNIVLCAWRKVFCTEAYKRIVTHHRFVIVRMRLAPGPPQVIAQSG